MQTASRDFTQVTPFMKKKKEKKTATNPMLL